MFKRNPVADVFVFLPNACTKKKTNDDNLKFAAPTNAIVTDILEIILTVNKPRLSSVPQASGPSLPQSVFVRAVRTSGACNGVLGQLTKMPHAPMTQTQNSHFGNLCRPLPLP